MIITEEEIINKVQDLLKDANERGSRNLEFLGIKNKNWKNSKTCILIIRCNIHNITIEISYRTFTCMVRNKLGFFGCKECIKEDNKKNTGKSRFLSEEEAKTAILNKIEELKETKGLDNQHIHASPILQTTFNMI